MTLLKQQVLMKHLAGRIYESVDCPITTLLLDIDVVGDMGVPDEITVTIEPGDRLNEPF